MPTKYTLEQVKNIFEKNKCSLITETYDNQLGKLSYIASCGHNNTISFIDKIFNKSISLLVELFKNISILPNSIIILIIYY